MEKNEEYKEIIIPKELEFTIEFKVYDEIWKKYLEFLFWSLCVPEEFWK